MSKKIHIRDRGTTSSPITSILRELQRPLVISAGRDGEKQAKKGLGEIWDVRERQRALYGDNNPFIPQERLATHPANTVPTAEKNHSGELKPRIATLWARSRPSSRPKADRQVSYTEG